VKSGSKIMTDISPKVLEFLQNVHPYDSLPPDELVRVARSFSRSEVPAGTAIYTVGDPITGVYLVKSGTVEVTDAMARLCRMLSPRNSFGERGLLRDGLAVTTATTTSDSVILLLARRRAAPSDCQFPGIRAVLQPRPPSARPRGKTIWPH
jgi:CBS domain-containing protein